MEETLKAFAAYSWVFYDDSEQPGKTQQPDFKKAIEEASKGNSKNLLRFVLAGYLFERQGASPYFAWKSLELLENPVCNAETFWEKFHNDAMEKNENERSDYTCSICGNEGCCRNVNAMNNPLNPNQDGLTVFHINFQDIVNGLDDRDRDRERIIEAYQSLDRLRGVGHKIAALFLRDLILSSNSRFAQEIQKDGDDVYWRLQPVDTWIRFIATRIGLCNETNNDIKAAKNICNNCVNYKVNPLRFNAGAWYFGSQVMRCKEQLGEILREQNDHERAKLLLLAGLEDDVFERRTGDRRPIANESARKKLKDGIKKCFEEGMLNDIKKQLQQHY